jgi:hypothetical protein
MSSWRAVRSERQYAPLRRGMSFICTHGNWCLSGEHWLPQEGKKACTYSHRAPKALSGIRRVETPQPDTSRGVREAEWAFVRRHPTGQTFGGVEAGSGLVEALRLCGLACGHTGRL